MFLSRTEYSSETLQHFSEYWQSFGLEAVSGVERGVLAQTTRSDRPPLRGPRSCEGRPSFDSLEQIRFGTRIFRFIPTYSGLESLRQSTFIKVLFLKGSI